MQRTFMSFINNQNRITLQIRFIKELPEQHAISHILNKSPFTGTVFKPNRIPNLMAKLTSHFLTNPCCNTHSRNPSGLRHPNFSEFGVPNFMQILRNLSRFARACISNYDQNLVIFYCF